MVEGAISSDLAPDLSHLSQRRLQFAGLHYRNIAMGRIMQTTTQSRRHSTQQTGGAELYADH